MKRLVKILMAIVILAGIGVFVYQLCKERKDNPGNAPLKTTPAPNLREQARQFDRKKVVAGGDLYLSPAGPVMGQRLLLKVKSISAADLPQEEGQVYVEAVGVRNGLTLKARGITFVLNAPELRLKPHDGGSLASVKGPLSLRPGPVGAPPVFVIRVDRFGVLPPGTPEEASARIYGVLVNEHVANGGETTGTAIKAVMQDWQIDLGQ